MTESNNFITDLDSIYKKESRVRGIPGNNKKFCIHVPVTVGLYDKVNHNYIIRKMKQLSKFVYIKDGCRTYFSDADILTMLLQIKSEQTMNKLIHVLTTAYREKWTEKYEVLIGANRYVLHALEEVKDNQILTNPQDIDISFDELYILINLILSKDRMSNEIWKEIRRKDYYAHTLSKYIALLKYYYYEDEKAQRYLQRMGYDVKKSIYENYDTTAKRDEKRGYFMNRKEFESAGVL